MSITFTYKDKTYNKKGEAESEISDSAQAEEFATSDTNRQEIDHLVAELERIFQDGKKKDES